jgi:hypothetical protein
LEINVGELGERHAVKRLMICENSSASSSSASSIEPLMSANNTVTLLALAFEGGLGLDDFVGEVLGCVGEGVGASFFPLAPSP